MLEYYSLEKGFVSEHIQLKQDVSKLYRYLTLLEKDSFKLIAMHDRRRELLEGLLNELQNKSEGSTL